MQFTPQDLATAMDDGTAGELVASENYWKSMSGSHKHTDRHAMTNSSTRTTEAEAIGGEARHGYESESGPTKTTIEDQRRSNTNNSRKDGMEQTRARDLEVAHEMGNKGDPPDVERKEGRAWAGVKGADGQHAADEHQTRNASPAKTVSAVANVEWRSRRLESGNVKIETAATGSEASL